MIRVEKELVIAGLDPAIHPLRKTLCEDGWMRGSSPRMTLQKCACPGRSAARSSSRSGALQSRGRYGTPEFVTIPVLRSGMRMPHRARDTGNKNEQAIPEFPPNRLLVEDLTAIGYPHPAPLLAASDHVFFEDTTARPANRSAFLNLFPVPLQIYDVRHCAADPREASWRRGTI